MAKTSVPVATVFSNPVWAAIWLSVVAHDGGAPGVPPLGPPDGLFTSLSTAVIKAQILEGIALGTSNVTQRESLLRTAKDLVAEATRSYGK